ncbi:MerR family transcriptional regulator [Streptacidiphilus sp. PB12-B1b]|uniref:MerR family transcriptional regulator n=1 Tax=Streptacidiphilus sp. PB12-B1b TaxID=2705012 RepID=UPI0015FB46A8|nr:MerR family transcriptional regulator [Streptacidiphilus sp. PB12-B1b]QMU77140.1 MerR family transcriptional regulator [Streptacidiphilus sp. PB12-B1b]
MAMRHNDPAGPADADAVLTTGAVARRLGVAPATVRSWERRYGLALTGAERAPGSHRRYRPQDLARLEHMCRLTAQGIPPAEAARLAARDTAAPPNSPAPGSPVPDFPAPGAVGPAAAEPARAGGGNTLALGRAGAACQGLARATVRMDREAMEAILDESLAASGVVQTWDALAAPVLRAVGRKWAGSNGRYVEVEHLLSCTISHCLHRFLPSAAARTPAAGGPAHAVALLAGTSAELHTLPLEALDTALACEGLRTRMLGAAVPTEALVSACGRTGAAAVVLWSQSRGTADTGALRALAATGWGPSGARSGAAVAAAGPGWQGVALPARVERLTSLEEAVRRLGRVLRAADGR